MNLGSIKCGFTGSVGPSNPNADTLDTYDSSEFALLARTENVFSGDIRVYLTSALGNGRIYFGRSDTTGQTFFAYNGSNWRVQRGTGLGEHTVWDAGNDGTGSTLDADYVDGYGHG